MRLLVITQKVDKNDPVLSFFHGWIEEFSKKFKSIVVICLLKGKYDLPGNVAVLSLGKEKWRSKLKYVFLLFYFSLRYFNRYDAVFIHMNEEYAVIAGWLWRLMGKKVYMWRNHHFGNLMTDIAAMFCNKVFCTSKYSYTAKYRKTILMPIGIDTEKFRPFDLTISSAGNVNFTNQSANRKSNSILFLGRIAKTKNVDVFVNALKSLKQANMTFKANIYGDALARDNKYYSEIKDSINNSNLSGVVECHQGLPNNQTPEIYNQHEIYVNLSSSGMYDKTIFEAMACGCLVLASNDNLIGAVDSRLIISDRDNPEAVAKQIQAIMKLPLSEKNKLVAEGINFAQSQSLKILSNQLADIIK